MLPVMADEPPPAKRRGGRPRVPEPGVPVSTWLRASDYDQIIKTANAHDVSISQLVRAVIRSQLK
jgi:hypothetical protein